MIRLHRNTAEAIVEALVSILFEEKHAIRTLEKIATAHPKWGARDRNLVHQATYEIIRWKIYYETLLPEKERDEQEWAWALFSVWLYFQEVEFPDWEEFASFEKFDISEKKKLKIKEKHIQEAIPLWLDDLGRSELKEIWDKEISSLNKEAIVILRVNRLLISPEKLQQQLQERYSIETNRVLGQADALRLMKRKNLKKNPFYLKGFFEIQDANSQLVSPFLDVQSGMNVIDGCAGAGGKALHLAALMRNKGHIKAQDISESKIKTLVQRAKRGKVKIISPKVFDESKDNEILHQWGDRVLIDAPCSGLGTLRRNPDIKLKITLEKIEAVKKTQQSLLLQQSKWVKPGGKLVYATCSVLPSENKKQIDWFLKQEEGKDFELETEKQLFSYQTGFDGFYMARLVLKK